MSYPSEISVEAPKKSYRERKNLYRVISKKPFLDVLTKTINEAAPELRYMLESGDKCLTVFGPINKAFNAERITVNNTETTTIIDINGNVQTISTTDNTINTNNIMNGVMMNNVMMNTMNNVIMNNVIMNNTNGVMNTMVDAVNIVRPLTPQQVYLTELLNYHIIPEPLSTDCFVNNTLYETIRKGNYVRINVYREPRFRDIYTVNGAEIIEPNVKATNGILQVIDKILIPPRPDMTLWYMIKENPSMSYLKLAVERAHLIQTLNNTCANLTMFMPNNRAFERLAAKCKVLITTLIEFLGRNPCYLISILKYHVLDEVIFTPAFHYGLTKKIKTLNKRTLSIDKPDECNHNIYVIDKLCRTVKVIVPNLVAINGVGHIVEDVLLPSIE
jgi:uncharacterized surface protein with fasciclin (FAS1) repeats